MAKGKKTDNETIYKIMLSMFVTNNFSETSRELNIPTTTVEKIYKDNKDKDEFVKLCVEKKKDFVNTADNIIDKATKLLDKRLTTALDRQNELDLLLDVVYEAEENGKKLPAKQQIEIAKKLSKIQLNGLSEITTAIGTMYDKRALAKGDPTNNINNNSTIKFSNLTVEQIKELLKKEDS